MSIIKSIMHKFNGTDYDTLHPETEHAQVTDFGQGVVTHLLASTLASTVTAVTSGSLFGKMVQLLLDATGMKYLLDTNGYICFGSLFGGLILQWGTRTGADAVNTQVITLPISVNTVLFAFGTSANEEPQYGHTMLVSSTQSTITMTMSEKGVRMSWLCISK